MRSSAQFNHLFCGTLQDLERLRDGGFEVNPMQLVSMQQASRCIKVCKLLEVKGSGLNGHPANLNKALTEYKYVQGTAVFFRSAFIVLGITLMFWHVV